MIESTNGERHEKADDNHEPEIICGFRVHHLASKFPLLGGDEFANLVEAIRLAGTVAPVELHEGMLIDGRNRGRAIEDLRRQGVEIALPTVEWQPTGDETLEEHIYSVNVHRRHLTPDQRAVLALAFLPHIRAARQAQQEASRFGKNGGGTAALISPPPDGTVPTSTRTSAEKDAASSLGVFAALAEVSLHKARLAAALQKAIDAEEVSEAAKDAVASGDLRLCDVVPRKKNSRKTAPYFPMDDEDDDESDIIDVAPLPSEAEARRRWELLTSDFAVADLPAWRKHFMKVIGDDQHRYDS